MRKQNGLSVPVMCKFSLNSSVDSLAVMIRPPYPNGLPSPYYAPLHHRWQKACCAFISENLTANALEWEREELVPLEIFSKFAAANFLLPSLPAPLLIEWAKQLGLDTLAGGLKVEEFDYLHFPIHSDEMTGNGLSGPGASLTTGIAFGVPPILKFGSKQLQERFIPDLLMGRARSCIAITEPGTGSDVAGIERTAVKSADGKEYIVNGSKKWITNGIWADFATTAVRTGGPWPSVVMGLAASGTTYIEFDDTHVLVENLIGIEGMGIRCIMTNFNHELLTIAIGVTRQARVAVSTALEYVLKREAFGKALVEQPVVRHRLAKITYQMTQMKKEDADRELGGLTGLAKAILLFGGNGLTKSGQVELIERIFRDVPAARISGGSEDVLYDLAIRELVKNYVRKSGRWGRLQSCRFGCLHVLL
ncbi:acyl-CoA dehydrogenase/oxidase [Tuber indicum]|nr:acyl-CoA dehydrogenase/oxidase [Tuber indicum]